MSNKPNYLMPNYKRQPVAFTRGEGAYLWDDAGNRYLDALSGVAVCSLGHAHPAVREALCEQAGLLLHTSNVYEIPLQERLAAELTRLSGMDTAFFCNSGTEAAEAAIKLARRWGHQKGVDKPAVLVMENSFHGRTLAALSATGNTKIQAGFEPLVEGFVRVSYNSDMAALEWALEENPDLVAILVEPVQGEGGVNIPAPDYLNQLRAFCDRYGLLLMLDEIQTGMGRTGQWFAYQHNDLLPDVLCLAKALGNGVPIGACLARGEAAQILQAGSHGSTFGGNPLACRAALAVIESMEKDNLPARAALLGERICRGLKDGLAGLKGVRDVRAKGLMIGVELEHPCAELVGMALQRGLLINVTAERVIRLLPPLIISEREADEIISIVSALARDFVNAA